MQWTRLAIPALLALAFAVHAQDGDDAVSGDDQERIDSSELPAEIMPLADESLILDMTRSGDRLVAVGERGHVLLSDDDGASWRQAASVPTRTTLTAVSAQGDRLWAVGHDVIVLHSADRGENWTIQQVDPDRMQPLLDVLFLDQNVGFALGAYGYFLSTDDGGETWLEGLEMATEDQDEAGADADEDDASDGEDEAAQPGAGNYDFSDFEDEFTDFHMNGIVELADGTLYIAAEAGTGLRSTDGGATWVRFELPYGGSVFGGLETRDGVLITYGLRGNVFESEDAGRSWSEVETGTLNSLLGGTELDDGTVVLVGANGEVLVRDRTTGAYRSRATSGGEDLAAATPGAGGLVLAGEGGFATFAIDAATTDGEGAAATGEAP